MTISSSSCAHLSDAALLIEVQQRALSERHSTAELIAALMELDARKLYLGQGCSSLFTYCTRVLHLSEHAAYGRIEAARAARRFPRLLDLLADGSITLTTVCLLAPVLTPDNHQRVLDSARHSSKREVEHLVAALRPQPALPSSVRKLPSPQATGRATRAQPSDADPVCAAPIVAAVQPPPKRVAEVKPLALEQYKVQFTVTRETYDKLRRAQDLLRHQVPNGDPAVVFAKALTLLVEELERRKRAATDRPQPARDLVTSSRHIPAAARRAVWARDGGRCAFTGASGRCTETGFLEFHHVVPFAAGGLATVENLQLRCRTHNLYEAEAYFETRCRPDSPLADASFVLSG